MPLPDLLTDRLWLRSLRPDDAADLHVALGDPECMRWWHAAPAATLEDSARMVAEMLDQDAGQWVFGRHESTEVLGHVHYINHLELGGHAGFGYALRRAEWGQGYASEAASAALAYGFDEAGIARAELWVHRQNLRSIRVAEKLGCLRRGEAVAAYPIGPTPIVIYGLTAEAWRGEEEPLPAHYAAEPIVSVTDVAAAAAWWRDVLGCRIDFLYGDPPTHAGISLDPPWAGKGGVQLTRVPTGEAGRGAVYVTVGPEIDRLAERAIAAGANAVTPLGDRPWGMREIELRDPDGNRIRLGVPA